MEPPDWSKRYELLMRTFEREFSFYPHFQDNFKHLILLWVSYSLCTDQSSLEQNFSNTVSDRFAFLFLFHTTRSCLTPQDTHGHVPTILLIQVRHKKINFTRRPLRKRHKFSTNLSYLSCVPCQCSCGQYHYHCIIIQQTVLSQVLTTTKITLKRVQHNCNLNIFDWN